MSRITGIGIVSLSVACWLGREDRGGVSALVAMLLYNVRTTIYLGILGIQGELVGLLLWPAVVAHAGVAPLLVIRGRSLDAVELSG